MAWRSTMRCTISAAVLATMLAGCASGPAVKTSFGGRSDTNVGLATRALAALNSNQVEDAVALAERAVEQTPTDAGFRTLLGNAYFAAGRFRSAEMAYKDGLSIYPNQPQAVLRLVLVEIAQGKNAEAVALLQASRGMVDAANYGLAMALAGRHEEAIAVLDTAARDVNADSRVRQNLALAYAFAGDWQQAQVVAAQDVPADQLDARLKQWMALAKPEHASDQVAALIGVTPASSDAGQPVRLALRRDNAVQVAEAPAPAPAAAPVAEFAAATPPVAMPMAPMAPAAEPMAQVAAALPQVMPAPDPAPAFDASVAPAPPPADPARVAAVSPAEAPLAMVAAAQQMLPRARAAMNKKRAAAKSAMIQASAPRVARMGSYNAVVQLGAYSKPTAVQAAWDQAARKYAALRNYAPVSARFDGPKGTVYRLSVKGFDTRSEATSLCASLKSKGRACFVRNVAGDKPVEFAAR